jgi:hypothetical protein
VLSRVVVPELLKTRILHGLKWCVWISGPVTVSHPCDFGTRPRLPAAPVRANEESVVADPVRMVPMHWRKAPVLLEMRARQHHPGGSKCTGAATPPGGESPDAAAPTPPPGPPAPHHPRW